MQLILLDPCPHYCTFARLGLCVYRAGHRVRFFHESVSSGLPSIPAKKLFSGVNNTTDKFFTGVVDTGDKTIMNILACLNLKMKNKQKFNLSL
jgi:hypothetical protein